jgi:hypothetical protein
MRVHGCGRAVAKMMAKVHFHVYSASFSFKAGRWYVSLAGVAAPFHHQRRSADGRHRLPVGADRGLKSLIVSAGTDGEPYRSWEGVKPLRHSQDNLLGLWAQERAPRPVRAHLPLRALWPGHRPGPERGRQPGPLAGPTSKPGGGEGLSDSRLTSGIQNQVCTAKEAGRAGRHPCNPSSLGQGDGPEPGQPGRRTSTVGQPGRRSRGAGVPPSK